MLKQQIQTMKKLQTMIVERVFGKKSAEFRAHLADPNNNAEFQNEIENNKFY